MDITEKIRTEWNRIKTPFFAYTLAQTAMNMAIITCQNNCEMGSAAEDAIKNLPFIAVTNLGYAKCVDYIVRNTGAYGKIGANVFSLAVTGAFYAYGLLTNDNNPALPAAIAGTVGILLTNRQVSEIRQDYERKMQGPR